MADSTTPQIGTINFSDFATKKINTDAPLGSVKPATSNINFAEYASSKNSAVKPSVTSTMEKLNLPSLPASTAKTDIATNKALPNMSPSVSSTQNAGVDKKSTVKVETNAPNTAKYKNPADKLNTYQYNFILLASSSTVDMQNTIIPNYNGTLNEAAMRQLTKFVVGEKYNEGKSEFITIVNTTNNADYIVTGCDIDTIAIQNNYPGVATNITLDIIEANGIMFTNLLRKATSMLKINAKNIFYCLIAFVKGFDRQGNVQSSYIFPRTLLLNDIEIDIDATGGKYKMKFFDVNTSVTPTNDIITPSINIQSGAATIGAALTALQDNLNKANITYDTVIAAGGTIKRVQYQITCPDSFKSLPIDKSTADGQADGDSQQVDVGSQGFNFAASTTITSMISEILLSSSQLTDQFNVFGAVGNNIDTTKTNSTNSKTEENTTKATSVNTVAGSTKRDLFTIRASTSSDNNVTVYRFDVIKYDYKTKDKPVDLHYNYLFTGQNLDIIDFNMRLEGHEAYVFIETPDKSVTGTDITLANDPANLPKKIADSAQLSLTDPARIAKVNYLKSFALCFSKCKQTARLVIRGNIALLANTTYRPLPHSTPGATDAAYVEAVESEAPMISRPLMISIKILSPNSTKNTWGESFVVAGSDGPTNAWFDGRYMVASIKHSFTAEGSFTQEIMLYQLIEKDQPSYEAASADANKNSALGNNAASPTLASTQTTKPDIHAKYTAADYAAAAPKQTTVSPSSIAGNLKTAKTVQVGTKPVVGS